MLNQSQEIWILSKPKSRIFKVFQYYCSLKETAFTRKTITKRKTICEKSAMKLEWNRNEYWLGQILREKEQVTNIIHYRSREIFNSFENSFDIIKLPPAIKNKQIKANINNINCTVRRNIKNWTIKLNSYTF